MFFDGENPTLYGMNLTLYGENPTLYGENPTLYGMNPSFDQFESAVNRVKSTVDRVESAVYGLHALKEQADGKRHRSDETANHDPVFAFHDIQPDISNPNSSCKSARGYARRPYSDRPLSSIVVECSVNIDNKKHRARFHLAGPP